MFNVQHLMENEWSREKYPSKQGMPSAMPRCLASLIMRENSEPLFRRNEVMGCEFASSRAAWCEMKKKIKLNLDEGRVSRCSVDTNLSS
jgi:hypothetical protein